MTKVDTRPLRGLLFPAGAGSEQDVQRWIEEPFGLQGWVLAQRGGGPCGVLAVAQAFMLAELLFERGWAQRGGVAALAADPATVVTGDQARDALVEALAKIIWRARPDDAAAATVCSGSVGEDDINAQSVHDVADVAAVLSSIVDQLLAPGGVVLLVYSVILTRGAERVREDMDDVSSQGLTGAFGHCTQELMNLLLCGVAASQVHDGTVDLGGGMVLRGVPGRPVVGYLTHLEALRYCQVGSWYKKPAYPTWVVGSESHYTVLCAGERTLNEDSLRTQQLLRAKRAFNAQDQQENGFIGVEKVSEVLAALDLRLDAAEVAQIISDCEMAGGAGVVLWTAFWPRVKRYLVPRSDWNCPTCTYANSADTDSCEMCTTHRRDDVTFDNGLEGEEDDSPHTTEFIHVNGIAARNGTPKNAVTLFKLTTVSRDLQAPSTHGLGIPFEEVLHTRWPGSVFAFPNDRAPSITG